MTIDYERHARAMNTDPGHVAWTITTELLQLRSGKQILMAHLDLDSNVTTKQWDLTPGQPIGAVLEDALARLRTWVTDGVRLL